MNYYKTKEWVPIVLALIVGAVIMTAVGFAVFDNRLGAIGTYKTVGVTTEAHSAIVEYATEKEMSYRDAASAMVNNYQYLTSKFERVPTICKPYPGSFQCSEITPFTGYIRPANYQSLSETKKIEVLEAENKNQLEFIKQVNQ